MDEVEVRELRYFIAVAEELNFTRAAERLGMAQPPLSAAIGKLERKLGVRLLERTSRRVALTPAGAVLLEQGRTAAEGVAAAVEHARRAAAQAGRLTVAVKPGAGTHLLGEIIRRYSRDPRMPEAHLLFGHPGGPATAVRSGAADVAVLRAPFDQRGLDTELLLAEPRIAVLPAGHRLASRRELRRADLAGEPMPRWAGHADPAAAAYWAGADASSGPSPAACPGPAAPRPALSRDGGRRADGAPQGPEINDITQLLDAVALGSAVAYVPASTADQHRRADLAFVPVSDLSPSLVVAAWPDISCSHAVAAFVRAAADVAAGHEGQAAAPPDRAADRAPGSGRGALMNVALPSLGRATRRTDSSLLVPYVLKR
jgi:DNA-binding transcriptional LysR family regulator